MPERSKGADLRSAGRIVRVGSNPTSGKLFQFLVVSFRAKSFGKMEIQVYATTGICTQANGATSRGTTPILWRRNIIFTFLIDKIYFSILQVIIQFHDIESFRLDGRAVQGASFRHWSLRRRGFKSPSNHIFFNIRNWEKQYGGTIVIIFFRVPRCMFRFHTDMVGWPSGPRRQFKALVSSEARVRIPLQSVLFLFFC